MSTPRWDASQGANPETCRHHVIICGQRDGTPGFFCFSCLSPVSDDMRAGRKYAYDDERNVWEYVSPRAAKKRHPLLGVRDSRQFKTYRTEFPAIFRFNGQLYQEAYNIGSGEERFIPIEPEHAEQWLRER